MATCKECLHNGVCSLWRAAEGQDASNYTVGGGCREFLDQARFAEVPCRVGDKVWAIRDFKGIKHPQEGIVSEMYFTKEMKLHIVVKYVARGEFGKTVFFTREEAENALNQMKGEINEH